MALDWPLQPVFLPTNGILLHVVQAGPADGPVVLCLHGFPEFWYAWRRYFPDLIAAGFRVWAPDLRGYNLSDRPAAVAAYRLSTLVDDVAGLIAAAGRPVCLVGHDWGGVIAWVLAARRPELITHLAIINAPHPALLTRALASDPAQRAAIHYMHVLRSERGEAVLARDDYRPLERMFLEPGLERGLFDAGDRAAYRAAWAQPGALTGMVNYYRALPLEAMLAGQAPEPDLPPITTPGLVLWGLQDEAMRPALMNGLEDLVLDLTIRPIPAGSHWVTHEERATVTGHLLAFLPRA